MTELVTIHIELAVEYCDANPGKNLVIEKGLDGRYRVINYG